MRHFMNLVPKEDKNPELEESQKRLKVKYGLE